LVLMTALQIFFKQNLRPIYLQNLLLNERLAYNSRVQERVGSTNDVIVGEAELDGGVNIVPRGLPIGKRLERAGRCPRLRPWVAISAGPFPAWLCRCVGEAELVVVDVDVIALVVEGRRSRAAIVPATTFAHGINPSRR
jgi:hypothetical protein